MIDHDEKMGRLGRAQKVISALVPHAMRGRKLPEGGYRFRCPLCNQETDMLKARVMEMHHTTFCALKEFLPDK